MRVGFLFIDDDDGEIEPSVGGSVQADDGSFHEEAPYFDRVEEALDWYRGRCDSCIVRTAAIVHSHLHGEHFWLFGRNDEGLRAWPGADGV